MKRNDLSNIQKTMTIINAIELKKRISISSAESEFYDNHPKYEGYRYDEEYKKNLAILDSIINSEEYQKLQQITAKAHREKEHLTEDIEEKIREVREK
jgi:hypothetical protein